MNERLMLDPDESLAAVKFKGVWRFFFGQEVLFLLDWRKYDNRPDQGGYRQGIEIVDKSNVEQWMRELQEVSFDKIPELRLEGFPDWSGVVRLTFVIDFDSKAWVGMLWHHDQSALDEYQPDDWIAVEDNVFQYLPDELKTPWKGTQFFR